ncbi:LuxR C-terminal-related transcriptional regulator [Isoptericola sp. NEAU-Y5]|uniref:LuxR C-terminal-related transcriptional regulator n=1 Tax=Isoptericola luteus TaxID=2879484 RepID=A0ABS7ZBL1_9MICO|nr:LuxR family transcriptional regulator [Isoptericola sp. NEAU-Y5]MCA5892441.1 LuxR C-terminal-related transcriptional regulator [Isoptericola sp. NEAU-Y5]
MSSTVAPSSDGRGAALRAARAAFADHDWPTVRDRYRAAAAASDDALGTDDLAALATACWWLGLPDESGAANAVVYRRLRTEQPARAGLVALELGFTEVVRGRGDVGAGWLARARRIFDEVPGAPERGYLLALDADLMLAEAGAGSSSSLDEADALARQVWEIGDGTGEPTLQALGLFLLGQVASLRGQAVDAARRWDEAMLTVRTGSVVPEWAGNLYCRMMQVCYELADVRRARHWTDLTEEWCRGHAPAVMFTGICRVHRVQLLVVEGEWARAEEEASRAVREIADLDVVVVAEAHYRMGELHRLRGALDDAERCYRQAHELGRDPLPGLALCHLRRGRVTVAASVLDAALAVVHHPLHRAPLLVAGVEVWLAADDPGRAATCLDELETIAVAYDSPGWRAEAARCRGTALAAAGKAAEAVVLLREARARWHAVGAPYEVARVRADLATALDALGDRDSARRERDSAAAAFSGLGATRDLARLSAQERRAPAPAGITPRELEVLAAVSAGRTNRQAAGHLGISERTIERHLANVYVKTGLSSRTGAVSWARDHDLL